MPHIFSILFANVFYTISAPSFPHLSLYLPISLFQMSLSLTSLPLSLPFLFKLVFLTATRSESVLLRCRINPIKKICINPIGYAISVLSCCKCLHTFTSQKPDQSEREAKLKKEKEQDQSELFNLLMCLICVSFCFLLHLLHQNVSNMPNLLIVFASLDELIPKYTVLQSADMLELKCPERNLLSRLSTQMTETTTAITTTSVVCVAVD